MDSVSVALRGSMPDHGEASASVAGANRPDFKFWADVFSKAQGRSVDGAANAPIAATPHGAPDAAAFTNAAPGVPSTGAWASMASSGVRVQHGAPAAAADPQAQTPIAQVGQGMGANFLHVHMPMPAQLVAIQADAADGSVHLPAPTSQPVPTLGPGAGQDPMLSARWQRTGQGAWTVVLRMPQRVSVPMALGLVAQAVHQEGRQGDRVESVVMNGRRVYQGPTAAMPQSSIQSIDWTL